MGYIEIGKKIAKLRNMRFMSQEQLANRVHLTRQAISHYENGTRTIDFDKLNSIARALNVDYTYLLEADDISSSTAIHDEEPNEISLLQEFERIKTPTDSSEFIKKLLEGFEYDKSYQTSLSFIIEKLSFLTASYILCCKLEGNNISDEYDFEDFLVELEDFAFNYTGKIDKKYSDFYYRLFELECKNQVEESIARLAEQLNITLPAPETELSMILIIHILSFIKHCRKKVYGELSIQDEYGLSFE